MHAIVILLASTLALAAEPAPAAPAAPAPATGGQQTPPRIVATKVDGVTIEKLKAASTPIDVAKFDHNGKSYKLTCTGATGLQCAAHDAKTNEIVAASTDLKLCKSGNDYAIMTEKEALKGPMIIFPNGMFVGDPNKTMVCGG